MICESQINWYHEPKICKTSIFHELLFPKYGNLKIISTDICLSVCLSELVRLDDKRTKFHKLCCKKLILKIIFFFTKHFFFLIRTMKNITTPNHFSSKCYSTVYMESTLELVGQFFFKFILRGHVWMTYGGAICHGWCHKLNKYANK